MIDRALEFTPTTVPGVDDDGFKAVARELAFLGRQRDALTVVERLSPGPNGRDDWKADGFLDVALGFAAAGRVKDALAMLDRIRDPQLRVEHIQDFLRMTEKNSKARKPALVMLAAVVPTMSDKGNWKSAAVSEIAEEYASEGEFEKARHSARTIPDAGFRSSGFANVAEKLIQKGEYAEAGDVLRDALNSKPKGDAWIARLLAILARVTHRPALARKAAAMLAGTLRSLPDIRPFPAVDIGSIMEGWAELGNVSETIALANTIPVDSYPDQALDPTKRSLARLVALGHLEDASSKIHEMPDPTHKAFALLALALALDASRRPGVLLEVERVASDVIDDEKRSFILSQTSIAWVGLHQYRYALDLGEKTQSREQARPYDQMQLYIEILADYLKSPN